MITSRKEKREERSGDLVDDPELRDGLVDIDGLEQGDDALGTDVVALKVYQLQRLVLCQCAH